MKNKKLLATLASTAGLAAAIAPAVCMTSCGQKSHFSVTQYLAEPTEDGIHCIWEAKYSDAKASEEIEFKLLWETMDGHTVSATYEPEIQYTTDNKYMFETGKGPIKDVTAQDQRYECGFEAICRNGAQLIWAETVVLNWIIPAHSTI